jgi:very-short-patch-repair endonuclease
MFQINAYNLPEPVREYMFAKSIRRRWRADFAWVDHKILCEVEGATWSRGRHTRAKGFQADCYKYNWANRLGWKVYRFTADDVNDGVAVKFLAEILNIEDIKDGR